MRTFIDSYLGIHPQALTLAAKRNDLLAANLANVDTPGYKARDIDFKAALMAAGKPDTTPAGSGGSTSSSSSASNASTASNSVPLVLRTGNASAAAAVASPGHAQDGSVDPSAFKYRVPMAPALDGNTVDEQLEQAAFAENGVRYQAAYTFLNNAFHSLMTAITGS